MAKASQVSSESLADLVRDTFLVDARLVEETDSTNSLALQWLADDPQVAAPWLLWAERQTAGRGRDGNRWFSQPGSLTFSLILNAQTSSLAPGDRPRVSLLVGLAIANTCRRLLPSASADAVALKWPNDVYLARRKLAGILIETTTAAPDMLVIGIGVNANNTLADAPPSLQAIATSWLDSVGEPVDCITWVRTLLHEIESILDQSAADPRLLADHWPTSCLLTGKTVTVTNPGRDVTGICRGIDGHGALLLEVAGQCMSIHSGTIASWQ